MGVRGYLEQERFFIYQGVQGGSTSRRTHGLRSWFLRSDQDSGIRLHRLRQGLRQGSYRQGVYRRMGEVQHLLAQGSQPGAYSACLLNGKLSGRGRHHHAYRAYRHNSVPATSAGGLPERTDRYRFVVHLLTEAGRQGDNVRSLRRLPPELHFRQGDDLDRWWCWYGSAARSDHAHDKDAAHYRPRAPLLLRRTRSRRGVLS